jgi:hypothetical protein
VESGLRPKASEIPLPEPTNFPFGDTQESSGMSFVLILRIIALAIEPRSLAVGESERLFYQILSINHEHGFTAVFAVRAAAILMG